MPALRGMPRRATKLRNFMIYHVCVHIAAVSLRAWWRRHRCQRPPTMALFNVSDIGLPLELPSIDFLPDPLNYMNNLSMTTLNLALSQLNIEALKTSFNNISATRLTRLAAQTFASFNLTRTDLLALSSQIDLTPLTSQLDPVQLSIYLNMSGIDVSAAAVAAFQAELTNSSLHAIDVTKREYFRWDAWSKKAPMQCFLAFSLAEIVGMGVSQSRTASCASTTALNTTP